MYNKHSRQLERRYRGIHHAEHIAEMFSLAVLQSDKEQIAQVMRRGGFSENEFNRVKSWLRDNIPEIADQIPVEPKGRLNLLFDENMSWVTALALQNYGHVSTVEMQGWQGKKDWHLYRWAYLNQNQKFDAIITKDKAQILSRKGFNRDLTNVALDSITRHLENRENWEDQLEITRKYPVIVHLSPYRKDEQGIIKIFNNHFSEIHALIESRQHAVIRINPGEIITDPRYSLQDLWYKANHPEPNGNGHSKIPGEVAASLRLMQKTAGRNQVTELQKNVRRAAIKIYQAATEKGHISAVDILDMIYKEIEPKFRSKDKYEKLLLWEEAVSAIQNLAKPAPGTKTFASSNMVHASNFTGQNGNGATPPEPVRSP